MKDKSKMISRGMEIGCDDYAISHDLCPGNISLSKLPRGSSSYFKRFGFKVPNYLSSLYALYNGTPSEKYIPRSLYYYYILPYLDNLNMSQTYRDKNMYSIFLGKVNSPTTILHNMGGYFYSPERHGISEEEAIERLLNEKSFIIKPALDSGSGRSVQLVDANSLTQKEAADLLHLYDSDYIVQKVVHQHKLMAMFNESSVNTCRLYTYRRVDTGEYVLLGALLRFGGPHDYRDNACAGGGFCRINPDGTIDDSIHRYGHPHCGSLLADKGLTAPIIPSCDNVRNLVLFLHERIPYFNTLSWDIAVDESGEPLFIELNIGGDCELCQITCGPMFGEYTDELMKRIQNHSTEYRFQIKRYYESRPSYTGYIFQRGKKENML